MKTWWGTSAVLAAMIALVGGCGNVTVKSIDVGGGRDDAAEGDAILADVTFVCQGNEDCAFLATGCLSAHCDPVVGECRTQEIADGTVCGVPDTCFPEKTCSGGTCVHKELACDDGNQCTDDGCDPATGCVHAANVLPCDDGDACTEGDSCSAQTCVPGGARSCDDGNPCTADSCDPVSGCASVASNEGLSCEDANPCTTDSVCAEGVCQGTSFLSCDDGNDCTDDSCSMDAAAGSDPCVHAPNSAPCDDGNACTVTSACADSACKGGDPLVCDDGQPCTDDSCDPLSGCVHASILDGTDCDDGSDCTTADHCTAGVCGGTGKVCDDGNPCTANGCSGGVCSFSALPDGTACQDGDACTQNDSCVAGACKPGTAKVCNDGNDCTSDACNATTGACVYSNLPTTATCNDGNACTKGDHCNGSGACVKTSDVVCFFMGTCLKVTCDPALGCVTSPLANGTTCDDGDYCTVSDACLDGACKGSARDCDDDQACTLDGCSSTLKTCTHMKMKDGASCDDGSACTADDRCFSNVCSGTAVNCVQPNPNCSAFAGCYCYTPPMGKWTKCDPKRSSACQTSVTPVGCRCGKTEQCAIGKTCNTKAAIPYCM